MPVAAIVLLLVGHLVTPAGRPLVSPPEVPFDVQVIGGREVFHRLPGVEKDQLFEAWVSLYTVDCEIWIRWQLRRDQGASEAIRSRSQTHVESVEFAPTAMQRSLRDRSVVYVAGTGDRGPVLERWALGRPSLSPAATIVVPSVTRTRLPMDPDLGHIADLAPNPWGQLSAENPEQIWVLEWESRSAFALDPWTGRKSLVVDAATVGDSLSMVIAENTTYGMVCLFHPRKWWGRPSSDDGAVSNVVFDRDQDGSLDGEFLGIPYRSIKQHDLWTAGTFVDPWSRDE